MKNNFKVLSPKQFSGTVNGDWGYEINGIRSDKGYVSRTGAYNAMWRELDKRESNKK